MSFQAKPENTLKQATTDEIVERLTLDMLQRFHSGGADVDWDQRIEHCWQSQRGVPFFPRSVTPTYLRGFPGQGKTTSYRVAAQRVAQFLHMPFVYNPPDDYIPTGQELLFVVQELSGQVSSADFGGIPNVQEFQVSGGGLQRFMTKLANKRLASLKHAGAAVLLLDDFSNASPNIQNVALSILMENRFQGLDLGNTLVGATGNLGVNDGTHVSSTSNAIVTRVASFLVVDTLEHWIQRTLHQYPDTMGDAGIVGFLQRYPDLFHAPRKSREGVPYPCPRTWSLFLPKLREIMFAYRFRLEQGDAAFPYDELELEAGGLLGLEAAHKLAAYFLSQMQDSDPLAKEVVQNGRLSEQSGDYFRKQYAGGFAANAQQFGYQFMTALADYAAKALLEAPDEDKRRQVIRSLAMGLYGERLDHALISYGSSYFALRLVALADGDDSIGVFDDYGRPQLRPELMEMMVEEMTAVPRAMEVIEARSDGQTQRLMDSTFIEVISNFSGLKSYY